MHRPALALAAAVCGLSLPAAAAGDDRYVSCHESGVPVDWNLCLDLTSEVAAAHRRGEKVEKFGSCIPEGIDDDQVRAALQKWLEGRPAYNRYSAYSTISGGLSVIYRCK